MEHGNNTIIKYFSPAWYASVMGTSALPLALSYSASPFAIGVAKVGFVLSLLMAIVIFFPWFLRFFLYREEVKKDFNHPVAVNFFPTMPIALILLSLNFLKFNEFLFSKELSYHIALILWTIGTVGIYLFGFLIVPHIFKHKEIVIAHANYGWYIPPVSKLLIPVAGFELLTIYPSISDLICLVNFMSLGAGFFLFLFVGNAVYHRNIFHELPAPRLAPTFFIGMVPTSIIAIDLYKLMMAVNHGALIWFEQKTVSTLAIIGILTNWGFAFWWFVLSLIILLHYIKNIQLPYALSWWAFTFPLGALTIASGIVSQVTGCMVCKIIYLFALAVFVIKWTVVAIKTVQNVFSGKVFQPAH